MLQYLTQTPDRYSLAEQCQMVIEGGCAWIQLHTDADDSELRELARELVPLCKETSTILMLENRPELAKELGLHGVHITLNSGLNPVGIRENFGPEAIIGVEVADAASILALRNADIDYVTLPESITDSAKRDIARAAKDAGNEIPIVFAGNYIPEDADTLRTDGASGILIGSFIEKVQDPVKYTNIFIEALRKANS